MQEGTIIFSWYITFSSEIPSVLTSKSKRRVVQNASGNIVRDHSNTYRLFQTWALQCKSLFSRINKVPCVHPFSLLHLEQKITTTCMTYVFPGKILDYYEFRKIKHHQQQQQQHQKQRKEQMLLTVL